jgi:hypothetical protein
MIKLIMLLALRPREVEARGLEWAALPQQARAQGLR